MEEYGVADSNRTASPGEPDVGRATRYACGYTFCSD